MRDVPAAIQHMGHEPLNPIGQCFESVAHQILHGDNPPQTKVVHAIVVTNFPGEEGQLAGHAWIEAVNKHGVAIALDTTWGKFFGRNAYRENLQVSHVVEYTIKQFMILWKINKMPGPWDAKIKTVVEDAKNGRFHKAL